MYEILKARYGGLIIRYIDASNSTTTASNADNAKPSMRLASLVADGWTVGGDDEDGLEDVSPQKKWWDGGLAVMFPKVDSRTIMVSPVSIRSKTNIVICPRWIGDDSKGVNIGSRGLIANTSWENAVGAKNMLYATEDEEYEKICNEAYDDARRVCEENSLV